MADAANAWDIVNAVAQSVGALGTTGALLVAARAYLIQAQERRGAQASRVLMQEERPDPGQGTLYTLTISNASDLPVYGLTFLQVETATWIERRLTTRMVGNIGKGVPLEARTSVLFPGDSRTVTYTPDKTRFTGVVARFTDTTGREWVRRDHLLFERTHRPIRL